MPRCPASDTGWTVRYTTDLTEEVWFYLRGEEYSAQIDYFAAEHQVTAALDGENTFRSALEADRVVAMIARQHGRQPASAARAAAARRACWSRLFG